MSRNQISFIIGVVSFMAIVIMFWVINKNTPELTSQQAYQKQYTRCVTNSITNSREIKRCNDIKPFNQ